MDTLGFVLVALVTSAALQDDARAAAGHLLYAEVDGTLMARPFDPERRMFTGKPTLIAEQVRTRFAGRASDAFFSARRASRLPGLQQTSRSRR